MFREPYLVVRAAVTLGCLLGVPAVALVGARGERPTVGRETAPPQKKTSADPRPGREGQSIDAQGTAENHHPAGVVENLPTATIRNVSAVESNAAPAATTAPPDLMTRQLARLQELGATYYRLESAPNSTADFAFHCRVAGVEHPFQAADPVATNAIAQVLARIEALRDRRESTAASPSSVYRR